MNSEEAQSENERQRGRQTLKERFEEAVENAGSFIDLWLEHRWEQFFMTMITLCFLPSAFCTFGYILFVMINEKHITSLQPNRILLEVRLGTFIIYPVFLVFCCNLPLIPYVYLRVRELHRTRFAWQYAYIFVYICIGFLDVTADFVIYLLGITASSFVILIFVTIYSRSTKQLTFNPTVNNHYYSKDYSISRNKGSVSIIESRVYKITLKNVGSEAWSSGEYKLYRSTDTGKICFRCDLPPDFTLLPQQQIELIPESFPYEAECIRVPGWHCFGYIDVSPLVKTFILHKSVFRFPFLSDGYHHYEYLSCPRSDFLGLDSKAVAQRLDFYIYIDDNHEERWSKMAIRRRRRLPKNRTEANRRRSI